MQASRSWNEDEIQALVGRIYANVLEPKMRGKVIDDIAIACGGRGATIFSFTGFSASNPPAEIRYSSDAIAGPVEFYVKNVILERNIACPRMDAVNRKRLTDGVFTDATLIGADNLKGDPLLSHITSEFNVTYAATRLTSVLHGGAIFAISALRDALAGMPSAEEMRRFDVLSAHLLRALQMFIKTSTRPDEATLALSERSDLGVIVLDGAGSVLHANRAARALQGNGFSIHNRQILADNRSLQSRLDRHLSAALFCRLSPTDSEPIALPRPHGKKPLIIQATPLGAGSALSEDWLLNGPGALVTLVDPDRPQDRIKPSLFVLLGLTEAEARVASVLATGRSPEAAAMELGLSTGTVRNHIKSIFSKLDIPRQSELVALAGRLATLAGRQH